MQHRDRIILIKILDEIKVALDMINNLSFDAFNSNEMLKRAVCMTVINIGELVKNLTETVRNEHKSIPWKNIAGFRDIAAHKYQTLKMSDVYKTVVDDFPVLESNIKAILESKAASELA